MIKIEDKFIDIGMKKINREIDLSWDEIAKMFNYANGEVARGKIKKYRKKNGLLPSNNTAIDLKMTELKKERFKIQAEKIELNKWLRENARTELFIEELKKSINAVKPPKFNELAPSKGTIGAVLGFADIHYGKKFNSLNNEYSVEILKDRMEILLNEAISICKKENISHLHVVNNGDSIEGILRISQLLSLQMGFTDMTINFSRLMVEWLNKLSQHIEITYHHVPSSNHCEIRPLGTSAGQFPKEDMERIMITYIHDMLANNPRVKVPLYEHDYARFDLCGFKLLAKHGHNIRNVKNSIKDLSMLHREFIDFLVLAHLHHSEELSLHEGATHNCEVIMLPSVMGSDSFSDKLLTGSKAGAKLCIFEENKGKTISYNIILN